MAQTKDRTLALALKEAGENPAWEWDKMPQQEAFLTSPNTFTCFSGGFGSGKTTALCAKVILLLTAIPNNLGYLGRLDGKSLRASTMQSLDDMLPKEYVLKRNDQQGFLQLIPEVGGGRLIYGDFKDLNDLKNIPLGFYAIDQMEEVKQEVWDYLAGRIRRRTPVLHDSGLRQYYVSGRCTANPVDTQGRHYALEQDSSCRLCGAPLPTFSDRLADGEETPPWDLVIYNRYGFGVCNPEGPSHWIYKYFWDLPGQHGLSVGKTETTTNQRYQGFHATIYDGQRAGFVDAKYVNNLKTLYSNNKTMWDRYLNGTWVEAEGLVYPAWSRSQHVYPYHATRYDATPVVHATGHLFEFIDHGLTAPTAIGWVFSERCTCGCNALNYFLIDEHYEGGKTVAYHAAQIKAHRARLLDRPIQATYLDSQTFSRTLMGQQGTRHADELYSVADEYMDHDIYPIPNQKDWDVGYNQLSQLLAQDPNHHHPMTGVKGASHLLVANTCRNAIEEFETYKWRIVKNAIDPTKDEPADGHDHIMDGLNGFLASRPANVIEFTPPKPEWSLDGELGWFDQPSSHMSL